jgi:hypothetical protein
MHMCHSTQHTADKQLPGVEAANTSRHGLAPKRPTPWRHFPLLLYTQSTLPTPLLFPPLQQHNKRRSHDSPMERSQAAALLLFFGAAGCARCQLLVRHRTQLVVSHNAARAHVVRAQLTDGLRLNLADAFTGNLQGSTAQHACRCPAQSWSRTCRLQLQQDIEPSQPTGCSYMRCQQRTQPATEHASCRCASPSA